MLFDARKRVSSSSCRKSFSAKARSPITIRLFQFRSFKVGSFPVFFFKAAWSTHNLLVAGIIVNTKLYPPSEVTNLFDVDPFKSYTSVITSGVEKELLVTIK